MRGRHEVWFDPDGETHERETFAGVVQWTAPNSTEARPRDLLSLLSGYRDALRSGTAKGTSEDATKTWINISRGHDIAVSRGRSRPWPSASAATRPASPPTRRSTPCRGRGRAHGDAG